ncbi:MAG: sugar transferase [Planctomycetaceae bacterium]|nr:sugar transferase [Planctomycetaceae bacterium]
MVRRAMKRAIDVTVAATVLLVCLPVLGIVALAIAWRMGRPVLFRQQRPGLGGRPFMLYKFRTMADIRDVEGRLLPDAERLTMLGRLLRRTSVDELPQLWNVLRGDMSLVGPRPLLMQYLDRYTPEQSRRHNVKPGITGWAQIHGRNALSWEQKFALDVWYVDHGSLALDVRILAATALKVAGGRGISAASCATMFEFQGSGIDSREEPQWNH